MRCRFPDGSWDGMGSPWKPAALKFKTEVRSKPDSLAVDQWSLLWKMLFSVTEINISKPSRVREKTEKV